MEKEFLTTQETAEFLGLTDGRIRTMILKRIIPAEKFGKQNMIRRSDAEKVRVYGKVGRPKKADVPQPKKPESKILVSVESAAVKLKLPESKVKAMIRDGRLPSEKVGGRRLVNEKDLTKSKPKKAAK